MAISVKGTSTQLTNTTQFKTATAVHLMNTHTAAREVIIRNEADNGAVGTIRVPSNGTMIVNLVIGQGLRCASTGVFGTHVASGSN
jgi:hypothetical protein